MKEWYTAAELAAAQLPGMPSTKAGVLKLIQRENWDLKVAGDRQPLSRPRQGRGGGREYHVNLLTWQQREALGHRRIEERLRTTEAQAKAVRPGDGDPELWAWYDRQPERVKTEARRRLAIVQEVEDLARAPRISIRFAVENTAPKVGVHFNTIWRWRRQVQNAHPSDWLPLLAPSRRGKNGAGSSADCSPEAWEAFKADYLRPEKPTLTACYRRLERAAAQHGWTIPSAATLRRRVEEIYAPTKILLRDGAEALKRAYPAQIRDRSRLHALEVVNADFHTMDVLVQFPTFKEALRASVVAIQDVYSGKILAWRVDVAPSSTAVRMAFHDVFEAFGIPDHAVLDNGREFAAKLITGGQPTRYRFKVRPEDNDGLLTSLGIKVHWAMPYSGQSKPVERAFRDFCDDVARHPAFAGAYTGNSPVNKPANYGERAVPLETFLQVLGEEVVHHNARLGRRSQVCGGVQSFDEAFKASYQQSPIRRATEAQLRMALLAAQDVTARKPTGEVHLFGNKFWAEWLIGQIGKRLVARFDPDNLQAGAEIYSSDGRHLGTAMCWEKNGFLDLEAARRHAKARRDFLRATKAQAEAERRLAAGDVAALLPEAPGPEELERRVVRLAVFGNTVRQFEVDGDAEERPRGRLSEDMERNFAVSLAAMREARERGLDD